ncbi:MAG: histidine--tRNA ligase, partial [Candidatus Nanopelagicaceae bacterium]
MAKSFQAPKGVSEYFPPRSALFEKVRDCLIRPARLAGYQLIELPVFEDTELFTRGMGDSTDVVTKEMYTFEDRGGRSITLRPEGTAGAMRAVIEHGLDRGQLPVKVFYVGPFFRAERPQAGRYRQFYQFGIEAIGVDDAALDVEVIAIADSGLKALGLSDYTLKITSLGDRESRSKHRDDLVKFIAKLNLDEETKARASKNPLRLFDDKRESIAKAMADAPLLLDYLTTEAKLNFQAVQEQLKTLRIKFVIEPRMVRGLDYYTRTTFEFEHHALGAQSGIGGGGRYDGLMKELGGAELSGIGFAMGIDRIALACEAEKVSESSESSLDLYMIALSSESKSAVLALVHGLREAGICADINFGDRGLKGAMKAADRLGAKFVAVIGEDELNAGTVKIKEMSTG